jgi:hypothetical protein
MRDMDLAKRQLTRLRRPVYGALTLAVVGSLLLGASAAGASNASASNASASNAGASRAGASASRAGAKKPRGVYAITFAPNSALYRLNPGRHTTTLEGRTGVRLTDLAFRGRTLYAISFTDLYWLNARTGARHKIGKLGVSSANALATSPATKTLYGAGRNGTLFRINARTGRAAVIGRFGRRLASAGDLTFADGHLYATVDRPGSTWSLLAMVNVRTGAATVIGPTGYRHVYGLLTSNGALYGATYSGKYLAMCRATGRGRVIWNDRLPIGGLAAPSPGTWTATAAVC